MEFFLISYIILFMYLKSLEINGFKSFAKKTNLDFKTKISSIVGPNGSGKSNVSESFRFVLGEQSMKNMRGKRGEDLIFFGTNSRFNRGAVKVIFDNKDKTLDIDYDEVVIERVVYRDGNNEYLINGSKVRAKDVLELLTSANIGASGHHIISQGEADKILSVSSKERKMIIEEALGLKAFVMRKNDSERKLKKTEENLKEVRTREKISAPRIKFLKREVEKIEKNRELREELFNLYSLFFPGKVEVEKNITEIKSKISFKEKDKKNIEEKILLKRGELKNSKNSDGDGVDRNLKIEKINQERLENENIKTKFQRELARNEILIEFEERKKLEFNSQKERVEENLKFYNNKLNSISEIIHKNWESWAREIIKTENISEERKKRWESRFVEYHQLPEVSKEKDRFFAKEILEFFGVKKTGMVGENFNQNLIEEKKRENLILSERIFGINEILESLSKKIRILNSNTEDAGEVLSQEIEIEILKMEKILSTIVSEISSLSSEKFGLERELESYKKEETFAVSFFGHDNLGNFSSSGKVNEKNINILEKILRVRVLLENTQNINSEEILEEYSTLVERHKFIDKEITDLEKTKDDLNKLITDITNQIEERFRSGVDKINSEFSKFFSALFSGGKAEIFLIKIPVKKDDEDNAEEIELGIDMKVSLPNKKVSGLSMLSGGERSLTSIALLFAMSSITPPPFIILDETDAALDEANSKRYGDMIEKLAEHSQLILITHNRETMSRAGLLYGVTMNQTGESKLLSVSLEEGEKYAK